MVVPYYGGRANIPPSRGPAGYEFDPRAFMQGARKWWPDTQRVAGQMWAGLPHLGAQIVGGEPASPAATFIRQSLTGTPYALQHLVEPKGAPPSATPQQVAGAGKQAARYAAGYLDPDTLTKRWTTHPGQVTADIAPLLAGPADLLGEAGLSALPTAARVALRGARAASYVASPATAPLAALGAVAKGARGLLRGPVTDATGAFTPAAVKAGQQAGLSPVDLEHPDFKPIYQQTLEQKGPTKAAAQEAIARYHSPDPQAPVPRQLVTGRTSPQAAQPKTADLIAQAKANNAARAQQLATAPAPAAEGAVTTAPSAPGPGGPDLGAPDTASPGDFTSFAGRPRGTPWTAPPDTAATRQRVLATKDDGTLAMPTNRIRTFLDTPQGQAAFPDPLDRSNVSILAAHNDMLATSPSGSGGGSFWPGVRKLGAMGVGALATHPIAGAAGSTAQAANALIGGFTGGKVEDWVERGFQALQKGDAGKGAPTPGGRVVNVPLALAGAAAPLAQAGPYVAPIASRTGAPPPPPPAVDVPTNVPTWKEQPFPDEPAPTTAAPAAAPAAVTGKAPRNDDTPTNVPTWKEQPFPDEPAPQADGGRVGFAVGGQVADMTQHLLKRAEGAQRAAQASTKPLLGLSDDTVAQALRVAQRSL